jgi:TonB family protein
MTPASFVRDLAAFWVQIACIVIVVAVLLRVVSMPARARYACLRLALLACLATPWMFRSVVVVTPEPRLERIADAIAPLSAGPVQPPTAALPQSATAAPAHVLPEIPWATVALVALFAGVAVRGLWLSVGVLRLRRLRRRAMLVDSPDYAAAQQQLGTSAAIAQVEGLPQPVTFGFRRPIVLLPETLAAAPAELRRAVVTHELFHVRRRDWLSVLGEEALRTLLWFHPAILWLTSHIQLAREEMVDELTVRATGDRRAYMQALLAFADTGGVHPAPAFAHRRQLFHRILSVSKEKAMSVPRIVASGVVVVTALAGASWYASTLFPIVVAAAVETPAAVSVSSVYQLAKPAEQIPAMIRVAEAAVSAVQRTAAGGAQDAPHEVTPENPIPRRTRNVQPLWPSQFAGQRLGVVVNTLVRIGRDGSVTDVVDKGCSVARSAQNDAVCRAFFDVAAAAIRQWKYDRPVQAPLQFSVVLTFRPDADPAVAQSVAADEWLKYVREMQDSLRVLAELTPGFQPRDQELVELTRQYSNLRSQYDSLERAQREVVERGQAVPDLSLQNQIARLKDQLREVERAIARYQASRDSLQAQPGTVSPTASSPFDALPPLVSPSGRAPLRVTPPITAPIPIKQAKPQYSAEAMRARVEGTVTMEALVDERGLVADARVVKSIPLLDQLALEAVRQWEFKPALLNGEPVPVIVMLHLDFNLRK